jgi:aspergillopepsin I
VQQRNGHTFYALANTTGQVLDGYSWKISYGDGSGASGIVYADKVTIGEATATQQAVEAATSVSSEFVREASDGLLGLGFGHTNTIKPTRQSTFFENIKATLKEPIFTVTLKKNDSGTYDFGFIDEKKFVVSFILDISTTATNNSTKAPLQYIPVNTTRGYWEYTATGYGIGNGSITPLTFQSIADTGTTLMLLPPAAAADYYSQVRGAFNNQSEGGYVFPCDSALPDLTVQMVGGISTVVPGHFVNRSRSQTPGSSSCYGGIQIGSPNLSIWGDVFLKSQFAVFDGRDPPRIGFAKQAASMATTNGAAPVAGHTAASAGADDAEAGVEDVQSQINWTTYLLKVASKWGFVTKVNRDGMIGERKLSMRYRRAMASAL